MNICIIQKIIISYKLFCTNCILHLPSICFTPAAIQYRSHCDCLSEAFCLLTNTDTSLESHNTGMFLSTIVGSIWIRTTFYEGLSPVWERNRVRGWERTLNNYTVSDRFIDLPAKAVRQKHRRWFNSGWDFHVKKTDWLNLIIYRIYVHNLRFSHQ